MFSSGSFCEIEDEKMDEDIFWAYRFQALIPCKDLYFCLISLRNCAHINTQQPHNQSPNYKGFTIYNQSYIWKLPTVSRVVL